MSVIIGLVFSAIMQTQEGCGLPPDSMKWRFVGCGWSPSECYYSCPHLGSYKTEKNPDLCFNEIDWACYCPVEED